MPQEITIAKLSGKGTKTLGTISLTGTESVKQIKHEIGARFSIAPERQSIRAGAKGKDTADSVQFNALSLETAHTLYVKDLGPQIGWDTVFYFEYAGPIFIYVLLFLYPQCVYSRRHYQAPGSGGGNNVPPFPFNSFPVKQINSLCGGDPGTILYHTSIYYAAFFWTLHYSKRILETAFVHRFSHGTMPMFNLFKNCTYYWGFALYLAYHINHPLYTPPPTPILWLGGAIFIFCELGNLSIHLLLRNLRPVGTSTRQKPTPNSNPFTLLYHLVSCPNYTFEFGSWVGFGLLTSSLPVLIFAAAGLFQMSIWALAKHRRYKKEFDDYPRQRKAIIPFIL